MSEPNNIEKNTLQLFEALKPDADKEAIRAIINNGVDLMYKKNGYTPLVHSIVIGITDLDILRLLIDRQREVLTGDQNNALHYAVESVNKLKYVRFLVNEGGNLLAMDENEMTPFYKFLSIKQHAFYDESTGNTVIYKCYTKYNEILATTAFNETLNLLLDPEKRVIGIADKRYIFPLDMAITNGYNLYILEFLVRNGADLGQIYDLYGGDTAFSLFLNVYMGSIDRINSYLKKIEMNIRDRFARQVDELNNRLQQYENGGEMLGLNYGRRETEEIRQQIYELENKEQLELSSLDRYLDDPKDPELIGLLLEQAAMEEYISDKLKLLSGNDNRIVNLENASWQTPLDIIVSYLLGRHNIKRGRTGLRAIFSFLVSANAQTRNKGNALLLVALYLNLPKIVSKILERPDIDRSSEDIISKAIEYGNDVPTLNLLLGTFDVDKNDRELLHNALINKYPAEVIESLIDRGAMIYDNDRLLHDAIVNGYPTRIFSRFWKMSLINHLYELSQRFPDMQLSPDFINYITEKDAINVVLAHKAIKIKTEILKFLIRTGYITAEMGSDIIVRLGRDSVLLPILLKNGLKFTPIIQLTFGDVPTIKYLFDTLGPQKTLESVALFSESKEMNITILKNLPRYIVKLQDTPIIEQIRKIFTPDYNEAVMTFMTKMMDRPPGAFNTYIKPREIISLLDLGLDPTVLVKIPVRNNGNIQLLDTTFLDTLLFAYHIYMDKKMDIIQRIALFGSDKRANDINLRALISANLIYNDNIRASIFELINNGGADLIVLFHELWINAQKNNEWQEEPESDILVNKLTTDNLAHLFDMDLAIHALKNTVRSPKRYPDFLEDQYAKTLRMVLVSKYQLNIKFVTAIAPDGTITSTYSALGYWKAFYTAISEYLLAQNVIYFTGSLHFFDFSKPFEAWYLVGVYLARSLFIDAGTMAIFWSHHQIKALQKNLSQIVHIYNMADDFDELLCQKYISDDVIVLLMIEYMAGDDDDKATSLSQQINDYRLNGKASKLEYAREIFRKSYQDVALADRAYNDLLKCIVVAYLLTGQFSMTGTYIKDRAVLEQHYTNFRMFTYGFCHFLTDQNARNDLFGDVAGAIQVAEDIFSGRYSGADITIKTDELSQKMQLLLGQPVNMHYYIFSVAPATYVTDAIAGLILEGFRRPGHVSINGRIQQSSASSSSSSEPPSQGLYITDLVDFYIKRELQLSIQETDAKANIILDVLDEYSRNRDNLRLLLLGWTSTPVIVDISKRLQIVITPPTDSSDIQSHTCFNQIEIRIDAISDVSIDGRVIPARETFLNSVKNLVPVMANDSSVMMGGGRKNCPYCHKVYYKKYLMYKKKYLRIKNLLR